MEKIYWITVLGNLNTLFLVLAIFSTVILMFITIFYFLEDGERRRSPKILIIIAASLFILSAFTPSKKDLFIIYGLGSALEYVESSDEAKKIPDKTIKVLNELLDEIINEND